MANTIELRVPAIGDFAAVEVIEVLVKVGDQITPEQSLLTLESDKATMEVPASHGGTVTALQVKVGDTIAEGDPIATLEVEEAQEAPAGQAAPPAAAPAPGAGQAVTAPQPAAPQPGELDCDLVVIGAGPGGYSAAFRAADLGLKVMLIERYASLGGVCLNVGCIPSKALLHAAKVLEEAASFAAHGIVFGAPTIELKKLTAWKQSVVSKLTGGLMSLAKQRQVEVVQGSAEFQGAHAIKVALAGGGERSIRFAKAIIATGSRAVAPPGFEMRHPRLMDSTAALALDEIPKRLLVIGGGIIGLEMATVYAALGAKITVVEMADRLIPGADADLIKPLQKRLAARYEAIYLGTKVSELIAGDKDVRVRFEGDGAPAEDRFERVLVAVGRRPNSERLNLEAAGVALGERGFITVDEHRRTSTAHLYAIGDVAGEPMLAHKATHEGKVAAEHAAGLKSAFEARVIPSVAYTDPEIAWVGLTEAAAKQQGIAVDTARFPWAANGRSLTLGRDEGLTKLLFDKASGQLVGGGIVGPNAGDLIAELALAIEMSCEAEDIALTIHPHPTLSETLAMAAEAAAGTLTDLYLPKKK